MATPEKLNLWDRFFNRYRKEIVSEGREEWKRHYCLITHIMLDKPVFYNRNFVKYKKIDRLTGSETIEIQYLN